MPGLRLSPEEMLVSTPVVTLSGRAAVPARGTRVTGQHWRDDFGGTAAVFLVVLAVVLPLSVVCFFLADVRVIQSRLQAIADVAALTGADSGLDCQVAEQVARQNRINQVTCTSGLDDVTVSVAAPITEALDWVQQRPYVKAKSRAGFR